MKQLAKKSMKRLAFSLLVISFLISNGIYYRIKDQAQSDFAKNTLSFLLMKENDADFIDTLEKFNNNHKNLSVVYLNNKNQILYNPDKVNIRNYQRKHFENQTYENNEQFYQALEDQEVYGAKSKNILLLAYDNDIGFYLNLYLLFTHILLAILINFLINRYLSKNIDNYISKIAYKNYSNIIKDNNYEEITPYIKEYIDNIERLSNERNILKSRLLEFTNITSNMEEGIVIFDKEGNIELLNPSAQDFLGVDYSTHITNLISDREYDLALREASLLKRSKSFDISVNGYYLRIFIDPLIDSEKSSYAMIIIDNSENIMAEQMRKEFSANVSHELKSPLTSINGYAELIAMGLAKEDDVQKFGEIIYKEGNRLLEMIDDIIKISRLDENNFDKDFVEVDIYDVVSDSIEKYQRISSKKNIEVENNIESFKIKTSKSLFYDLISNIYENAIKYNKINGSISFSFYLENNTYYLIIADTGIGIAANDTKRIFERFYVVDKSRKRNQKSTGLGLSIVKHIINYLEYNIEVESKLGEGTKFKIAIPLGLDRKDSL